MAHVTTYLRLRASRRVAGRRFHLVPLAVVLVSLAGCATAGPGTPPASASPTTDRSARPPSPDPRVGLRAGWMDAGQAAWNLRLVSATPPPESFYDPSRPGDFRFINSDLAFKGHYVVQGNFWGIQIWDVARPEHPRIVTAMVCPGSQNDVSVYGDLLFVSVESPAGRVDCGTEGVQDSVSPERMRGIRIFDISDIADPKPVTVVQTCRGSHTHTVVTDPSDPENLYIYVSGSAPVRSPRELEGCSALSPDQDPSSELFRIEVIRVPLAHPERAQVVSKPPILAGLTEAAEHGPAPEDVAAARKVAARARTQGKFTVEVEGVERVLSDPFARRLLDSLVAVRGGSGEPTAADSASLREQLQGIVDEMHHPPAGPGGERPGPVQCHDITAYPEIGLAGGACAGYGLLLDIRDPVHPRRIGAVADSNFAYWHSATFSNDGSRLLFTDEWGGGLQPRCRTTDDPKWGADAIFTRTGSDLTFASYFKLPAAQTSEENCVAHNGSLVPVPGRDIFVQAWYQGGVSVIDWTDPSRPVEIAYFDRGPMDSTKLVGAGSWSAYWYNGHIYSSEISRGLDILDLVPSAFLSENEIEAAKEVRFDQVNVQHQQRIVWPASVAVAGAYLDQLERSRGLSADRVAAVRRTLDRAAMMRGSQRSRMLYQLAGEIEKFVAGARDAERVRILEKQVRRVADGSRTVPSLSLLGAPPHVSSR